MSKKKRTNEEFIEEIKQIHGNNYDYSLVDYTTFLNKVKLICKDHGVIEQLPPSILRGSKCPWCVGRGIISLKDFLEKANKIHNNKYIYDKTIIVNATKKCIITCPIHGDFEQTYLHHLRGQGCAKCSGQGQTTESFIKKAKQIYGDKYDYSKTIFINAKTKIIITCFVHGDFEKLPYYHLKGGGCQACSKKAKLTKKIFLERAIAKHGDKFNYDKVEILNVKTKVIIICRIHGEFKQKPIEHIYGNGCPSCAKNKAHDKISFVEKANKVHNNKYSYDDVCYVNNHTAVIIKCKIHGNFLQRPGNHLSGAGCEKCAKEKLSVLFSSSKEEFINKAILVHGYKYDYSEVEYKNSKTVVKIICKKHGVFKQKPENHVSGNGCEKCATSISNKEILWLDFLNIPQENRNVKLKINGRIFKVDGFDPKTNTIYEFDGDFWHGNPKYFNPEDINKANHQKFGDLYKKTIDRKKFLENSGYKVVSIWESDWNFMNNIKNKWPERIN